MSSIETRVTHFWHDSEFTLSPVKEVSEFEDALTIYSDLISDADTPVKVPNFGPKTWISALEMKEHQS